ncbi:MAG: peptidylprolyl isomerase [Nitrospinaceae bacterium]
MKSGNLKFVVVLALAAALIPTHSPGAESKKNAFRINGKAVPKVVASVNGTELSSELLQRKMATHKFISAQRGQKITPASEEKIARELLQVEIDQELMYQTARKAGIMLGPDIVENEMKKMRDQFPSEELFARTLAMQKLTVAGLREVVEKQLVIEKYMRKEIAPKTHVAESQVEAFYKKNPDSFRRPELFKISHIFVATLDPATQGKTGDPASQKKAQKMIAEVNREAQMKINSVAEKLKAGEDFADLAKKYSEDEKTKDRGGDLGSLDPAVTLPNIAMVMTKLRVGGVSEVIQSPLGFHILKLNGKVPSEIVPFKDVKADILNHLLNVEIEKQKNRLLMELKKTADIKIFI